jgi:hypothetical protein
VGGSESVFNLKNRAIMTSPTEQLALALAGVWTAFMSWGSNNIFFTASSILSSSLQPSARDFYGLREIIYFLLGG